MSKGILGGLLRRAPIVAAAALAVAGLANPARAAVKGDAYSVSLGYDFSSHFISYGVDVWGGGGRACPWSTDSTMFAYGTVTAQFTDQISGFVNVWSDINNNADSDIGGSIQEVDLNIGGTYTWDKFPFTLANGCWWYAGDTEHILDFSVAYNDMDLLMKGFALNPSFLAHWRYEGNGDQNEGWAFVPGIRPTYTLMSDSKYPITLAFPINCAFFTNDLQGGDSGFGYFSAGIAATVPLAFVPEKFGSWSVTGSATYYCTESDALPSNPEDQFVVTALSIGVSL
jgi:hypothetical protein